ncbi:MAG: hypothetical protein U0893_21500 [Chloroflexota bacterium]
MRNAGWRSVMRAAILGMMFALVTTIVAPLLATDDQFTAQASVASSKSDEQKDKDKKKKEQGSGNHDQDHTLNGQVLEIDTLKDPPELILGSVDGRTVVRVLKTDEIAINGIRVGDYIEAEGEKINEQLFEATQLSVSARYQDPSEADNDNKD